MDDSRRLTQDELDEIDDSSLRMQILTLYQQREVAQRLNELENKDYESGKAVFNEYRELFTSNADQERYEDYDEAFWISSKWLHDLYTFKSIEAKWS